VKGGILSIIFPDVSFYQAIRRDQDGKLLPPAQQKAIDFLRMKQAGMPAVIIRAGQDTWIDPEFRVSWENAKIAELPRASYFFVDKDSDVKQQARFYWSILRDDPGEGFISGDFETGSPLAWDKWYQFMNELQQISGYSNNKIFFYSNFYFFNENKPPTIASQDYFARYPLWLANYTASILTARIPGTWDRISLHQYGTPAIGYSLGVWTHEIDMNLFNDGQTEFEKLFGKVPTVVNPPIKRFPASIIINNDIYRIQ
jgi:GH25 family lysozyme M1 (1,4-beta-N-acetylmuramidase)